MRRTEQHFAGCLLGGAVGDALGAPVEFMRLPEIRQEFGPEGVVDYAEAYGRLGAITDDTQMAMFTAEGILRGSSCVASGKLPTESVHRAYLRWLKTQGTDSAHEAFEDAARAEGNGWLVGVRPLHARRAPGNTCLSALLSPKIGTVESPLNASKGCGGVMRMAPAGLSFADPGQAFEAGCEFAAITHGHPTGYLAAGCFAATVSSLVGGADLPEAVEAGLNLLKGKPQHAECAEAVSRAVALTRTGEPSPQSVESIGEGWVAEEALAIAFYCALSHPGDFAKGVLLAVNHGGDSDSAGAIAGNLLGLAHGERAIPGSWLDALELREEVRELACDLLANLEGAEPETKYPQD